MDEYPCRKIREDSGIQPEHRSPFPAGAEIPGNPDIHPGENEDCNKISNDKPQQGRSFGGIYPCVWNNMRDHDHSLDKKIDNVHYHSGRCNRHPELAVFHKLFSVELSDRVN